MLEALLIVRETEAWTNIRVHGQHIRSEDNEVADHLSRGRTDEALRIASKYFGYQTQMVSQHLDFTYMFNRVVEAVFVYHPHKDTSLHAG